MQVLVPEAKGRIQEEMATLEEEEPLLEPAPENALPSRAGKAYNKMPKGSCDHLQVGTAYTLHARPLGF